MDHETKTALADRLKKVAAQFGLQEQELAQRLGISKQAMSNYTQAKNEPKPSLLIQLVKIFGINPSWLLMGEGEMLQPDPAKESVRPAPVAGQSPMEREMETFVRLMREHGAGKDEIREGLLARMGAAPDQEKNALSSRREKTPRNPPHPGIPGSDAELGEKI